MHDPRFRDGKAGFFKLIDEIWLSDRRKLALHRICTVMRAMCAQTVICEDFQPSNAPEWKRISQDIAAIKQRIGDRFEFKITKLTFLCARVGNESEFVDAIGSNRAGFLGYAIIVAINQNTQPIWNYIAESVVRECSIVKLDSSGAIDFKIPEFHYLHVQKLFNLSCLGNYYTLNGTFFCQQNAITGVCAHACAVMVLNNCKETSQLVCCEDVNLTVCGNSPRQEKIDPKLLPRFQTSNADDAQEGLRSTQLESFFRANDFEPQTHNFKSSPKPRYFREVIYGFIESGYPAILAFNTCINNQVVQHVAPLFGHTLNWNSWFPIAFANYSSSALAKPYLSTLSWADAFIAHDDNFGMLYSIPAHSFIPEEHSDPGKNFAPMEVMGIFPTDWNIQLYGHTAERLARNRLYALCNLFAKTNDAPVPSYHLKHLLPHIIEPDQQTAVFRASLVKREAYLSYLRKRNAFGLENDENSRKLVEKVLAEEPHFWLVEVTEPDLYVGNKAKVVDVLLSSRTGEVPTTESNAGVILINFPCFGMIPTSPKDYGLLFTNDSDGYWPLYSQTQDFS